MHVAADPSWLLAVVFMAISVPFALVKAAMASRRRPATVPVETNRHRRRPRP